MAGPCLWLPTVSRCFYGDTFFAFAIFLVYQFGTGGMSTSAAKPLKNSVLGIFGHGCAHMWLAHSTANGVMHETPYERGGPEMLPHAKVFGGLFVFWYVAAVLLTASTCTLWHGQLGSWV